MKLRFSSRSLPNRFAVTRQQASHFVCHAGHHPVARPWVSLVSLGAFLGVQWLPGVFVLQEIHAQEQLLTAQQEVALQKERAIETSRAAQSKEQRAAQRSQIKVSEPTECGPENCAVTPKALDLSQPPTEKALRMAGGMGGALSPIGPADVPYWADKYDKELKTAGIADGLRAVAPPETVPERMVRDKKERLERLKKINLGFGQAMQKWNKHQYREAAVMLKEHVKEFSDSPWGGEAMLHLGCDAKYNGRFAEAAEVYNDLLEKTSDDKSSKSFEIHQKAKLRWADLNIAMGKIDDAQTQLANIIKTDSDWRRRTWAIHWSRMMGLYKKDARTLRACGTKALGFMLASLGNEKAGERVGEMQPKRENGFTLAELQVLAGRNGLSTRGFRGRAADLASLPKPLIIHYDFDSFGGRLPAKMAAAPDAFSIAPTITAQQNEKKNRAGERKTFKLEHRAGHFLVVRAVNTTKKSVSLFDPQERRGYALSFAQLDREWSGTGLVRVAKNLPVASKALPAAKPSSSPSKAEPNRLAWLTKEEMRRIIGGCCGVARTPSDLGPAGPKPPDCGAPSWSINQVSLNMYLSDTPLWYKSAIGPSVNITMNYNSQDATNQSVAFGNKWAFNYGSYVVEDTADGGGQVTVFMPNSRQENFIPNGMGGYTAPIGSFTKLRHPSPTRYEVVEPSGEVYVYDIPAGTSSLQAYLIQIRDPWGNALSFGYDSQVHVTTITDALGRVTKLDYDVAGHIIKATDPFGRFATFAYDQWGNMVEVVDMEGNAFQYTYDRDVYITQINTAQGAWSFYSQLPVRDFPNPGLDQSYYVTITDPLHQETKYGWDGFIGPVADVSYVINANKVKTQFRIMALADGKGRISAAERPTADVHQPIRLQTTDVDLATGQPRVVTDNSGASTSFTYNAQGQIDSITDARNSTTRFLFAPNGIDMVGVIDATGKRTATSTFNDKHQITSVTDVQNNTASFTYTGWGALKSVTYPDSSVTTYNYDETPGSVTRGLLLSVVQSGITVASYQYDAQGRVLMATGADNKSVSYEYNDLDYTTKSTLPDGTTSETDYACCGIASATTARNGKKTYYDYDALKRLTRVQDAAGNTVDYDYDPVGNLTSISDSKGAVTSWQYDDLGRVIAKQYPDGSLERYGYDTVNRVLSRQDAKGQVFKTYYDANGNMVRLDRPGTANDVTISYDGLNRPYGMKDVLGTTVFGYDNLNRVTSIDGPWANDTLSYHYDNMGRRDWMRINGTDQTSYSYDNLNRMSGVTGISGQFTFGYDGNTDRMVQQILPSAAKVSYSYDSLNRMTQVLNQKGTNDLISRYTYGYETSGYEQTSRRTYRESQVGAEAQQRVNYQYDDVGQLLSQISTDTPTPSLNQRIQYDAMGNRTATQSGQSTAQVNTSTTRNPLNQLTQMVTNYANTSPAVTTKLQYDVLGNMTAMTGSRSGSPTGTSQYAYTDQDQLASHVSYTAAGVPNHKTTYVYDGLGRKRITQEYNWNPSKVMWEAAGEKRYLLDGLDVVQERDASNAVQTVYTRAGNIGGLLSKSKRVAGQADVHLFYHYDGQGNVVQLTNLTQSTVADYRYDAFGGSLSTTGAESAGNLYRFSTKELQINSGLYDYGLRFYSPALGRFINRDPSGEAGGLNLYAAAANNPLTFVDRYGLSPMTFIHGLAVGLGVSIPTAWGIAASVGIVSAAFGELAPVITVIGGLLGAIAVAEALREIQEVMDSNLCPDEKHFRLGLIAGSFIGSIIGGAKGNNFKPSGTNCFVAGTLVTMADGTQRKIEQIKEGDIVLARDPKTGKDAPHQVKTKKVRHVEETLLISFSDGAQVETTKEHPFYVEGKGFVNAGELGIGTSIVTRAGPPLQITSTEIKKQSTTVYNLSVEGVNTFFVSGDAFWVHNYGENPEPSVPDIPEAPVTPTDLYAFGNTSSPRPPRPGQDFEVDLNGDVIPNIKGASTFDDPIASPLSGPYHRLPAGTKLPEGLNVKADGSNVGGPMEPGHHSIYPTTPQSPETFTNKFLNLGWLYEGGKKAKPK